MSDVLRNIQVVNKRQNTLDKDLIKCSNCSAPLAHVMITKPEITTTFKVRAKCCHCGDSSFIHEYVGGLSFASTDYTTAVAYPEELPRTKMSQPKTFTNNILIETIKTKEWVNK